MLILRFALIVVALTLAAGRVPVRAQAQPAATASPAAMDMSGMRYNRAGVMQMYGMSGAGMQMEMSAADPGTMASSVDVGIPMTREGSGTSWLPDTNTIYAHMFGRGDDMEMTHGALFARAIHVATARGNDALVAPGWFMYMRSHPTSAAAQLGFRLMLTPDPFTVAGQGYPALFQTGEEWRDQPLHDVQHPHDLISEISAAYSVQLNAGHSAFVYAGYPGEPALGPPAFMHRPVAADFGPSPIGHHWEDATHVTFGVLTAGISATKLRLETSVFTGREPNQARYNFDPARLDSQSARLSWNPNATLALQISYGFITSPEALAPAVNVRRPTASVLFTNPLGFDAYWTHALIWGRNDGSDGEHANAFLYETAFRKSGTTLFGRFEQVQKSGSDLVLAAPLAAATYGVGAYTIGLVRDLHRGPGGTASGLGADLTVNALPAALAPAYGGGRPISVELFLRVRPAPLVGQDTRAH